MNIRFSNGTVIRTDAELDPSQIDEVYKHLPPKTPIQNVGIGTSQDQPEQLSPLTRDRSVVGDLTEDDKYYQEQRKRFVGENKEEFRSRVGEEGQIVTPYQTGFAQNVRNVADLAIGATTGGNFKRVKSPKQNFSKFSEAENTKTFRDILKNDYPDGIVMYHETPLKNLKSIKTKGLIDEETNAIFGTIGEPSNFVSGNKAIVKVEIPSWWRNSISNDMRYTKMSNLLNEHQGVKGADVVFNDSIPKEWITDIKVVKGNK